MTRAAACLAFLAAADLVLGTGAGALDAPEDEAIFQDGFESGDTSAWAPRKAFRMTDLDLKDPHVFATLLSCTDFTNFSAFDVEGINPTLEIQIQTDGDEDGFLDLSLVTTFDPLDQTAGSGSLLDLVYPECSEPMESTSCSLASGGTHHSGASTNQGDPAVCLGPVEGTTSGYSPAVISAIAPADSTCFAAAIGTVTVPILGGIQLVDSWIGGEWFETPAIEIRNGLLRGFLTEATADATIVPEGTTGVASIDGEPISELLRGGAGSCSQPYPAVGDRDTVLAVSGWYFYLNFSAVRVPYVEQP